MNVSEIITAAKEGRVIVLPCKPGETVYEVQYNTEACKKCESFHEGGWNTDDYCHSQKGYTVYPDYDPDETNICPKHFLEVKERPFRPLCDLNLIGTSVFLSQIEAEAAIRGVFAGSTVLVEDKHLSETPIEMTVSFLKHEDGCVSIVGQENGGTKTYAFTPHDIDDGTVSVGSPSPSECISIKVVPSENPAASAPAKKSELCVTVEDGEFVDFPCRIGDEVYLPARDDLGGIITYNVIKVGINNEFGAFFVVDDEDKEETPIKDIGKDIFLTEEEAVAHLEESLDETSQENGTFQLKVGDILYVPRLNKRGKVMTVTVTEVGTDKEGPFFKTDDDNRSEKQRDPIGSYYCYTELKAKNLLSNF